MKSKCLLVVGSLLLMALMPLSALAHDLHPPDYRGDPLSVLAHWQGQAGMPMELVEFGWVDDGDPETFIYPGLPEYERNDDMYVFYIPNILDELPIKFLRLQLTWTGTTSPPLEVTAQGQDGQETVVGVVTFVSPLQPFTQPDGGYQYYDIEFRPNPDFETLTVILPPDSELTQVVVDSISIIPEPSTLLLLMVGIIPLIRKIRERY